MILRILCIIFSIEILTVGCNLNNESKIYQREKKNLSCLEKKMIGNVEIQFKHLQQPHTDKDYNNLYLYFLLSFTAEDREILTYNISDISDYSNRLKILDFNMEEYVLAITDREDTIKIIDSYHERSYGLKNKTDVIIVFRKKDIVEGTNEKLSVYLKDIGIGVGIQKFTFNKECFEIISSNIKYEN